MNNQENNLPAVVTVESLKESHGGDAIRLYNEISQIGGFGDFSRGDFHGGHPPLALAGLQDEARRSVAELLAASREIPIDPNDPRLNKISVTVAASEGEQENQEEEGQI